MSFGQVGGCCGCGPVDDALAALVDIAAESEDGGIGRSGEAVVQRIVFETEAVLSWGDGNSDRSVVS